MNCQTEDIIFHKVEIIAITCTEYFSFILNSGCSINNSVLSLTKAKRQSDIVSVILIREHSPSLARESTWWNAQCTGCPMALGPLCFLLFCQFLLYQNTKLWWVLKNSGNLLSYWHQNFKNRWRNSWDNWHQRWHLSFKSWHFTIPQGQKNNFGVVGGNFDVNYLSYF